MPNYRRWNGGATAVAQVRTTEITGAASGSTITTTLTAEDGSTQSVVTTMTNSTLADQATVYRNALAASSQSEFQKLTYSVDGAVVTMTASIAGRPFSMSITGTTGSASVSNTAVTASAGPNDFNTAANWSGSTKPANDDLVTFSGGSFDVLYGLDQSAIVLRQFSVTRGFSGNIGTNTAALRIQVDDGDGEDSLNLGGSGTYYSFDGDYPIVNITRNLNTTKVAGELREVNITGPDVGGTLTLDAKDAHSSGNGADINITNVSPALRVVIPDTATETGHIVQDSGIAELSAVTKSAKSSLLLSGSGEFVTKASGKVHANSLSVTPAAITVLGGLYRHESDADFTGGGTRLAVYGGRVDMSRVSANTGGEFLSVGVAKILGGTLDLSADGNLVQFTSLAKSGGTVVQPASAMANAAKRS